MCNYSNYAAETRDAVQGEVLVVHYGGFSDPENLNIAVCLKPGTELGFDEPIRHRGSYRYSNHQWPNQLVDDRVLQVARSRIVGPENLDALEFSDGRYMLLSNLIAGQRAKVLQLPSAKRTTLAKEIEEELV